MKTIKHIYLRLFYCHLIKKLNSFNRGLSLTVTLSEVEGCNKMQYLKLYA